MWASHGSIAASSWAPRSGSTDCGMRNAECGVSAVCVVSDPRSPIPGPRPSATRCSARPGVLVAVRAFGLAVRRDTIGAVAIHSEEIVGIDTVVVAVAPEEHYCVAPDRL